MKNLLFQESKEVKEMKDDWDSSEEENLGSDLKPESETMIAEPLQPSSDKDPSGLLQHNSSEAASEPATSSVPAQKDLTVPDDSTAAESTPDDSTAAESTPEDATAADSTPEDSTPAEDDSTADESSNVNSTSADLGQTDSATILLPYEDFAHSDTDQTALTDDTSPPAVEAETTDSLSQPKEQIQGSFYFVLIFSCMDYNL